MEHVDYGPGTVIGSSRQKTTVEFDGGAIRDVASPAELRRTDVPRPILPQRPGTRAPRRILPLGNRQPSVPIAVTRATNDVGPQLPAASLTPDAESASPESLSATIAAVVAGEPA